MIYGSLPPRTKLAMAAKFNDPAHPCKVLVATDAVGMGLNLAIRRVVFETLTKTRGEEGRPELLAAAHAKQIGGRAGRFGTQHGADGGVVTCLRETDMPSLRALMTEAPVDDTAAGLHPTFEQIELFSYHLPHATLSALLDIFAALATVDQGVFFLCHLDDVRAHAEMIEHVPLPLKVRYTFCLSPFPRRAPIVVTHFQRMARRFRCG